MSVVHDMFRSRKSLRLERARIGQQRAILTIERCVIGGKQFVSIVLPTRYGKTDVIRMSAGSLIEQGHACAAIVLSPNTILRGQVTDPAKLSEMFARYEPSFAETFKVFTITCPVPRPNANGEWLLSASIHLVQRNLDLFGMWIKSEANRTGKPVLVYIDEAHTGGTRNKWGEVSKALSLCGAVVILLTATPYRADGDTIHGFRTELLGEEPYTKYVTSDGSLPTTIKVTMFEGTRKTIKLFADYEYSLKEAWEEDPLPVAKVEWLPFRVNLEEFFSKKPGELADLTPATVRGILGRIVRDPKVVEEGVRVFVTKVLEFKSVDDRIAGIVFCGNDREDDLDYNAHAKMIELFIKLFAPHLKVITSTSSGDDDDDDAINRYMAGDGDVLIVKQRASVGLDVARLKVALDLSPVRTRAAFIQRLMRIATVYKNFYGVFISPNDPIAQELFETIVVRQGGEATVVDVEKIRDYEVPRKDPNGGDNQYLAVVGTDAADFGDSDQNWADKDSMPLVEAFRKAFPWSIGKVSHAVLAEQIKACSLKIKSPAAELPKDFDTNKRIYALQVSVRQKMEEVIRADRARRCLSKESAEDYGATARLWYRRLYQKANVQFVTLEKQTDISVLVILEANALAILADLDSEGVDDA